MALVYLDRLEAENVLLGLTEHNVHRMIITAVMIAAKVLDDRVYSNAHFARVGGMANVQELNKLEWKMLTMLEFKTRVCQEEYISYVVQLSMNQVPGCCTESISSTVTKMSNLDEIRHHDTSTFVCLTFETGAENLEYSEEHEGALTTCQPKSR